MSKEPPGRPEYITCIKRRLAGGDVWCGRQAPFDFQFESIDHAAANGAMIGRLVACPECVAAVTQALHGILDT